MSRQFRYAGSTSRTLAKNPMHQFALSKTLGIYQSNSAYTFIPKNGCSTIRFSLAIANGCIKDGSQINWIHQNNGTFSLDTREAFLIDYAFVILRCPFRRLFSAFMDKVVNIELPSWGLYNDRDGGSHPHRLTFAKFVQILSNMKKIRFNEHWRPQSHFLVYETYDRYFCFEDFGTVVSQLESDIGFHVHDSRPYIGHSISELQVEQRENASDIDVIDLLEMRKTNKAPDIKDMYDENLVRKVLKIYSDDIALYVSKFGVDNLLFDPKAY